LSVRRWRAETTAGLAVGVVMSFLVAFFSGFFRMIKDRFLTQTKAQRSLAFAINYLIKLIVMFLIMSMSGWVCIVVIVGMSLGELSLELLG
jgi:hypothetical protein